MEFIEKSGELNELTNYRQLTERCKVIGAEVSKVVFRGYYASPKLQHMHDNAIQARTRLKMEVGSTRSFKLVESVLSHTMFITDIY